MKKRTKFSIFGLMFLLFTCFNSYFSNLITYKLAHGWIFSNSIIKVVCVKNTGAAFSIMQDSTNFLIFLSIFFLTIMLYVVMKNLRTVKLKDILFISLLASGIIGNLYERIFYGYVRDFFELTFVNFPIFNISDVFINIGVFGIILIILLTKKPIKLL